MRSREGLIRKVTKDGWCVTRGITIPLCTDAHRFCELKFGSAEVVDSRKFRRIFMDRKQPQGRMSNRIRRQTRWSFLPRLELESDLSKDWTLESIQKTPKLKEALRLVKSPFIHAAAGIAQSAQSTLRSTLNQLDSIQRQSFDFVRRTESMVGRLHFLCHGEPANRLRRDVTVLSSIFGVGRKVHATSLAEALDALRFCDLQSSRCLSSVVLAKKQSGNFCSVTRRHVRNDWLRTATHHLAFIASRHDRLSMNKYTASRVLCHSNVCLLLGNAGRLIFFAIAILKSQTEFDQALIPLEKQQT